MQVAALERLVCLVKVGSRTMPLVTPAFQSNGSAELQRCCPFPFGSLRFPWGPLGGFATSRSPLAADAARGAVDNINDSDVDLVDSFLVCELFSFYSLLLYIFRSNTRAINQLFQFSVIWRQFFR